MKILNLIVVAAFFAACAHKQNAPLEIPLEFEQNASALPNLGGSFKFDTKKYLEQVFSVWEIQPKNDVFWAFDAYKSDQNYYGESRLKRDEKWFARQKDNANIAEFGSLNAKAIITRQSAMRAFATRDKLFLNPNSPAEGYPFDYLQISVLQAFAPVLLSHFSKDRAWAFVKSGSLYGFVDARDVKILSNAAAAAYKSLEFGVFSQDKIALKNKKGEFSHFSRAGAIFPYSEQNATHFIYGDFIVPKAVGGAFLELNDANAKFVINSMLGENYGWGGENFLRDCSLFTRDFFAVFGLWLPRNSQAQAQIGASVDLRGLSNDKKAEFIAKMGVPMASLLIANGHVMLYGGTRERDIIVIHDAWGVRTRDGRRAMIGKIAITSTQIARDVAEKGDLLLSRIHTLSILAPQTR